MLQQNFMMQTANSGQSQYIDQARQYMKEYMDKGYLCGQAAMKALARAYKIPLCQEIIHQSLSFTEGGGVGDRCALFQASVVLVGLQYGRISPKQNRDVMRQAALKLAEEFRREEGSYFCRDLYHGNRELCIRLAGKAAGILFDIYEGNKR